MKVMNWTTSELLRRFLPQVAAKKKNRKRQKREHAFLEGNWSHQEEVSKRRYASYDEYLKHQKSKLGTIQKRLGEKRDQAAHDFLRCFETCEQLQPQSSVLCLGARIGTEVEAFIRLGHFAVGIDLNPGDGNEHVLTGDFHKLVFADNSVDVVYTNCLDHLFDLAAVVGEMRRVLKPDGIAIIELMDGYDEGFLPGNYEATLWAKAHDFARRIEAESGLHLEGYRRLDSLGKGVWSQAVFRKPASESDASVPRDNVVNA